MPDVSLGWLVHVHGVVVENARDLGQMLYVVGREHVDRLDGYVLSLVRSTPDA